MKKWTYKENTLFRMSMWLLLLLGDVFWLWIFVMILLGVIFPNADVRIHITGVPFFFFFCLLWNMLGGYLLCNAPQSITLTDEGFIVIWSKRRKGHYPWNTVRLITIGLNPIPVIIIQPQELTSFPFNLPRMLMLNGWSKKYKELVKRIEHY